MGTFTVNQFLPPLLPLPHFIMHSSTLSPTSLSKLFTLLPNSSAVFPLSPTLPYSSIHSCVASSLTSPASPPKLLASHRKVFHILYFVTVTQHTAFIITHPTLLFVLEEACWSCSQPKPELYLFLTYQRPCVLLPLSSSSDTTSGCIFLLFLPFNPCSSSY